MTSVSQIAESDFPRAHYVMRAEISISPAQISAATGLRFARDLDDLGELDIAFVVSDEAEYFYFLRYIDTPRAETGVYIQASDSNYKTKIQALLMTLGLSAQIQWSV